MPAVWFVKQHVGQSPSELQLRLYAQMCISFALPIPFPLFSRQTSLISFSLLKVIPERPAETRLSAPPERLGLETSRPVLH
jgi:hypothetical protein